MKLFAILEQTVRIAIPYLFAAAGGVLAERAGIVSLTLEGFMLSGAFAAVLGSSLTGNPWIGILCGMLGGLIWGLLHALASIRFRADQIVVGIALNLLAVGTTRLFLKLIFKSSSNSGRVAGFGGEGTGALATFQNPLLWLGLLIIPILAFWIDRTPFGLRVRALAVAMSGVVAALGGVYLALDQHQFTDEMTAGRGFIALAAIITGSWRPLRAGVACLVFAAAETLQIQLQTLQLIPSQIVATIPYVLTIVVLVGWVGRATPPAALGKSEA